MLLEPLADADDRSADIASCTFVLSRDWWRDRNVAANTAACFPVVGGQHSTDVFMQRAVDPRTGRNFSAVSIASWGAWYGWGASPFRDVGTTRQAAALVTDSGLMVTVAVR